VHGRTRACAYTGPVEYETIRAVKAAVSIPVIANGDIATPEQAKQVLDYTGADAVMIGRAARDGHGSSGRSATISTTAPPAPARGGGGP